MITDEEFDTLASKYFTKIRKIGARMPGETEVGILRGIEEMNEALERIKEIRNIQRRQREEEE